MSDKVYGVILAGGSGSRLWPLSREMFPKQLQSFNNQTNETLFQTTFKRLSKIINSKEIITVTNLKNLSQVKSQLDELIETDKNLNNNYKLLSEPISKNTAGALYLAVEYILNILEENEDTIIIYTPSDLNINDIENFTKQIKEAINIAKNDYIVTFGIKPSKVETGLGYIKVEPDEKLRLLNKNLLRVSSFKEKPEYKEAKEYVNSEKYFWNSGIFVFKASVLKEELKKYYPKIYEEFKNIKLEKNTHPTVSFKDFNEIPDISIDYAIMEFSKKLVCLPFGSDWQDLGSWENIYDVFAAKNVSKNCIVGNVIDIDSKESIIYSNSRLVTSIGLENIVVVETEDAVLVCNKAKSQEVKKIYNKLKDIDNNTHKVHRTVYRPWGHYSVLQDGKKFLIKCITVNPESKLSLQYHHHRSEHWVILEGEANVIKGDNSYRLLPGESIDIDILEPHSLQNLTSNPLKILEVQRGEILDENDIVRLKDIYGRV